MKALKTIGIVVLAIIVLLLLIAFFLPATSRVEESVVIDAKANVVFKQVNNLENWEVWTPFVKLDPSMKYTNEGAEFGVGAKQKWTTNSGDGEMTIVESKPYKLIKFYLDFYEQGNADVDWTFVEEGETTTVKWGMDVPDLSYPFERYQGLLMKSYMKKVFADGLSNLKEVCEEMAPLPKIEITEFEGFHALAIYDSAYYYDIADKMTELYGALFGYLGKKQITPTGAPFTIYYTWQDDKPFLMNIGVPVAEGTKGKGKIKPIEVGAGKVVVGEHYGAYDKSGYTHELILEFIKEHQLEINGSPRESYLTDHSVNPDTATWLTKLYWPIK